MPETCEDWLGLVNSYVYCAYQTLEINQVQTYHYAAWELGDPLSKKVFSNVILFGIKDL